VDELRVPFVKIASMDLNNYPLLAYFAKKNVPLIISVGLSELYEIDKAIRTIEQNGCRKIVILHCVSIYPPADHEVNLRNINTLAQMYPDYQIGFSDHSLGINLPIASVALGVPIIEKHFTLDKTLPGWDHKVSADEGELRQICEGALQVYQSMGSNRIVAVEDEERRNAFRRSLVLKCNLKKGEKISRDNLTAKRPGDGLKPEMIEFVVGRTVAHDMEANSILYLTDII
jgi:N-acetylneuraminate synthase